MLAATAVALGSSLVVAVPFAVVTWGIEREAIPSSSPLACSSSSTS